MQKKDIQLLLIVFGILIGFASWQFVYKENQEKTEKLQAQNEGLQDTVYELEALEAQREEYIARTEEMEKENVAIINSFAAGILAEDAIMYLTDMEFVDANEVKVASVTMGQDTEIPYAAAAAVAADSTTADQTAAEADGSTADGAAGGAESTGLEIPQPTDEGIRLFAAQDTVSFTTTYNGIKNIMQYVYEIPGRKSVSSVNLTFSETGYLTGTMAMDFYHLSGAEEIHPYTTISIPGVQLGTDNPFGTRSGAQGGASDGGQDNAGDGAKEDAE